MDEKTVSQVEKTIQHVAREIRRAKELDQKNVLALAKLTAAYSGMLEKRPEPWNYEEYGDPDFHERLEPNPEEEEEEAEHGRKKRKRKYEEDY